MALPEPFRQDPELCEILFKRYNCKIPNFLAPRKCWGKAMGTRGEARVGTELTYVLLC